MPTQTLDANVPDLVLPPPTVNGGVFFPAPGLSVMVALGPGRPRPVVTNAVPWNSIVVSLWAEAGGTATANIASTPTRTPPNRADLRSLILLSLHRGRSRPRHDDVGVAV